MSSRNGGLCKQDHRGEHKKMGGITRWHRFKGTVVLQAFGEINGLETATWLIRNARLFSCLQDGCGEQFLISIGAKGHSKKR